MGDAEQGRTAACPVLGVGAPTLVPGSTEESIYITLRNDILWRRLLPGEILVEQELAARFGVSRTPIRSVLKRLSYEGLVTRQTNRRAKVIRPEAEDVRQVFWLRRELEALAAAHAAQNARDPDIEKLAGLIAQEERAFAAHDKTEVLRVSLDFHVHIAEMSGNRHLARFVRDLNERSVVYVAFFDFFQADPPRSPGEHRSVLQAIAAHDSEAAAAAMARHVLSTEDSLDLHGAG